MKTVLAAALAALIALPAAARADGPATMRFAFPQGPKSYVYTAGVVPWSKAVTAESGGAVDIKLFPGPQLANEP